MSGLRVAMQSLAVASAACRMGRPGPFLAPSAGSRENTMSLWLTIALGAGITAVFIALTRRSGAKGIYVG